MVDGDFQKDFFSEGRSRDKTPRKPGFLDKYLEHRFLPHIKMPVEYTIVIGIGILVLTIIAYAVGVEKGKRMMSAEMASSKVKVSAAPVDQVDGIGVAEVSYEDWIRPEPETGKVVKKTESPIKEEPKPVEVAAPVQKVVAEKEPVVEKKEEAPETEYAIQLASFRDEGSAKTEAAKLKKKGINADFSKKGEWFQVFSGGYRTRSEADNAVNTLAEMYPDCFIKRIR